MKASEPDDDSTPADPKTGKPYFDLDPQGLGDGWSAGPAIIVEANGFRLPRWCYTVDRRNGLLTMSFAGNAIVRILRLFSRKVVVRISY